MKNIQKVLVTDNSVVMRYTNLKINKKYFIKIYSSKKYYHNIAATKILQQILTKKR